MGAKVVPSQSADTSPYADGLKNWQSGRKLRNAVAAHRSASHRSAAHCVSHQQVSYSMILPIAGVHTDSLRSRDVEDDDRDTARHDVDVMACAGACGSSAFKITCDKETS